MVKKRQEFDGSIIKKARIEANMSQQELAEGITTQSTISLIESQNRLPNANILHAIADRLDLDVEEFITGDDVVRKAKEIFNLFVEYRNDEAIEQFERYQEDLSSYLPIRQLFNLLKANQTFYKDDYDSALYFANQATNMSLTNFSVYYQYLAYHLIGSIWYKKDNVEKASKYYQQTVNIEGILDEAQLRQAKSIFAVRNEYVDYLVHMGRGFEAKTIILDTLKQLRGNANLIRISNLYLQLIKIDTNANLPKKEIISSYYLAYSAAYLANSEKLINRISEEWKAYDLESFNFFYEYQQYAR